METVSVVGVQWVMEFDEDGFGCIADDLSGSVHLLEDLFKVGLWITAAGEFFTVVDVDGQSVRTSLTVNCRKYEDCTMQLSSGPHRDATGMPAYLVKLPRGGMRSWWVLVDVYKHLGMTSYKHEPSKWVFNSLAGWDERLSKDGFIGHLMFSGTSVAPEQGVASTCKFLPQAAASTLGLLSCIVRWCSSQPAQGGLRDEAVRAKARALLDSLTIVSSCRGQPWEFVVSYDDDWSGLAPCLSTTGSQ